jgi:F-type H+-transporting ATPase subunit c
MKRSLVNSVVGAIGFLVSSLALAYAGDEGGAASQVGLIAIGAGLAVGAATFAAATSQGRAASAAFEGIARNPGASKELFLPFILGLVFMEFQALLGFVIAILWTLSNTN